jgi:hypothetical protein
VKKRSYKNKKGRRFVSPNFKKQPRSTTLVNKSVIPNHAIKTIQQIKRVEKTRQATPYNRSIWGKHPPDNLLHCKVQRERIRRAYFGYRRKMPHVKGNGVHNDRFTTKPCRR